MKLDKLLCKKTIYDRLELFISKGEWYSLTYQDSRHIVVSNLLGKDIFVIGEGDIYYMFYTIKELRRLKLDKIDEKEI